MPPPQGPPEPQPRPAPRTAGAPAEGTLWAADQSPCRRPEQRGVARGPGGALERTLERALRGQEEGGACRLGQGARGCSALCLFSVNEN